MIKIRWSDWIGKKVYIILNNKRVYSGTILDYKDKWLFILDKFNKNIAIQISHINIIQEDKKRDNYEC